MRVRRRATVTALCVLAVGPLRLQALPPGLEREVGVLTRVSPYSHPLGPLNVHNNPTTIAIGNMLYLFVQGGEQGDSCNFSDSIIAYRAPLDTNGDPGTFARVGRISPCITPTGQTYPMSFGPGQVIRATFNGETRYHLVADVSDTNSFKKVWHASSVDGDNWHWVVEADGIGSGQEALSDPVSHVVSREAGTSFLKTNLTNLQVLNPIVVSTHPLQDDAQWWGFLNFIHNSVFKVGRFLVDWSQGDPTIRVVTFVDGSGNYFFTEAVDGILDFEPHPFIQLASIKSLFLDAISGTYQAWGSLQGSSWSNENVNCDVTTVLQCLNSEPCTDPSGDPVIGCKTDGGRTCTPYGAFANVYEVNTAGAGVGSNLAWWQVEGRYSMETSPNQVTSHVRFLPTGYATGRYQPFRWTSSNGTRYLFSATNDENICSLFLYNQFYRSYIVMTRVDHHAVLFDDGFEAGDLLAWSLACPPSCE